MKQSEMETKILLLLGCVLGAIAANDKASFYGDSYISLPLQEAKSTSDIRFRFRTHRADALVLLAAGRIDYCMVRLENARISVRINLGAGESEVSSPEGLQLNDMTWHDVLITRQEANLTLTIDNAHSVKKRIPGRFFELNIHFGVFIGGQGDFSELFLGHMDNFRGCLAEVSYNNVSILQKARERSGQVQVNAVTWNCAAEFDADVNTDISFVQDGAYMMLQKSSSRAGARWQLEIKTTVTHGTLIYNTGQSSRADFVAVEIIEGRVRILFNKGTGGVTELYSPIFVSNGIWHKLDITYNPAMVELIVDNEKMNTRLPHNTRHLDLGENYYIGGIEESKRVRASGKGLKTVENSFKGCIRGIDLDGHAIGLPSMKVTQGTVGECVWRYPCTETPEPCVPGAQCSQRGVDGFKCRCDEQLCVNTDYAEKYKVFSKNLPVDLEMLSLNPLECPEGESKPITRYNIHMVLDYPKFGARDTDVLFHVIENPKHGRLSFDLWDQQIKEQKLFTLLDLSEEKVKYVHDGTESRNDFSILEMELKVDDTRFTLPVYLQGRHRFSLHVNITPVNDPPVLIVNNEKVFQMAQGTRKIISSAYIHAEDTDSDISDLVITIMSMDNTVGHIERNKVKVMRFSQKDLDGLVSYVHLGEKITPKNNFTKLILQVSDGIESSPPITMKLSFIPLQLRLVNNTGLILVYKAFAFITDNHLKFTSNVEDGLVSVKYEIVQPPSFGCVQKLRQIDSTWQCVDYFTNTEVSQNQVRYLHSVSLPKYDEFKFRAFVRDTSSSTYDFRITFTKLKIGVHMQKHLEINGTREAFITTDNLLYQTEPMPTSNANIVYKLTALPKYGVLYLENTSLEIGDVFTQQDLDQHHLKYQFYRRAYSQIHDEVAFKVSVPECEDTYGSLSIIYKPETKNDTITKSHLQVSEGSRIIIPRSHLNFDKTGINLLTYNITSEPEHGRLEVFSKDQIIRERTKYFTSDELNNNEVYYIHDDSESRNDSFHFMALSSETEDFEYVDVFHVGVLLKNDNSPKLAFEKVFHVVTGGSKLITRKDLLYIDEDIDTRATDIVYTRKEIPFGEIYNIDRMNAPVYKFSQQDINNNKILFKHHGDDYGKITFWINDGEFDVNGDLEVQASEPFIRNLDNNGSIVQNGKSVKITPEDLEIETNINCKNNEILYEVVDGPNHGAIKINDFITSTFTQEDLINGKVSYTSTTYSTSRDNFKYRLSALNTSVEENFYYIKVYPASYWEPLQVIANNSLLVEESTSAVITKQHLEVLHPLIPASDIMYIVTKWPEYGYLEMQKNTLLGEEDIQDTRLFDQSIINAGKLHYIQSGVNKTMDRIVFNVTNGITWLNNLVLNILVLPEHLYLGTEDLYVVEGKSVVLSSNNLKILSEYYKGKVTEFKIVKHPSHGILTFGKLKEKINRFSYKQLEAHAVVYVHNGSENLEDSVIIIAIIEARESLPSTLKIRVTPINDETPKVLTNTGLDMWKGGIGVIGANDLYVKDDDTPPENLTYQVLLIRGGHVALTKLPNEPLTTFTQEQIINGDISFVHTNDTSGKILFTVSDGIHSTSEQSFYITTNPVTLKLINKNNFHIFPLLRKPLTPAHLLAISTDNTREIKYMIRNGPHLGRLVMESEDGSYSKVVQSFTQEDVNTSRVFYEHTHPFSDMYANDSIVFDVASNLADTITNERLSIDISVSSGGLDRCLSVPPLLLSEGGTVVVRFNLSSIVEFLESHAGLMSPIVHAHASQPQHGVISFMQDPNMTIYSQNELDSGQVKYQHDHSDSTEDFIKLAIYLLPEYILLCNVTIPIKITPINDQPFRLVTQAPHISVVQGENKTLDSEDLLTEDLDTPPEELIYDIISGPTQGRLIFRKTNNNNVEEMTNVNKFSQDDINNRRIVYEHSGTTQMTTFYFRVWDGKFKPAYTVFNIHVLPVELNVSSGEPIYLQQGSNVASLRKEQFIVETNANTDRIFYNITRAPRDGVLYVRDAHAFSFSQSDLESTNVMYMQTDMTTANDSFQVSASIGANTIQIPNIEVFVQVQPLMQITPLPVVMGDKTRIPLSSLDATPLAKLTSSNPIYRIIRKPRYGKLKKIIRSSGEHRNTRDREVSQFTHEEVLSGVIYYVPKKSTEFTHFDDNFKFTIAASIFQPAVGELKIKLMSQNAINELPGPGDPESHEGGMQVASPNMSSDYLLIVTMVGGVVVLGLCVITIIKCRNMEPIKEDLDKDVQPIPLPRPPDHLMPHSPHVKRYISSEDSLQIEDDMPLPSHSDVPHCKVIALSPVDSMLGSDIDMNIRYPYGDDLIEDWSTYDISEIEYPHRTTNSMIQRNQYWV